MTTTPKPTKKQYAMKTKSNSNPTRVLALLCLTLWCVAGVGYAQHTSVAPTSTDSLDRGKLRAIIIGGGTAYTTSLVMLDRLWYQGADRGKFRFFNDNAEWKQVDKVGHFYSTFHIAQASGRAFRWAGLPNQKAYFWGSVLGAALLVPIEVLDGFSEAYGASYGDLLANTAGAAAYYGQMAKWGEVRLHPKFSFSRSPYAKKRPSLLGDGLSEELLKDYNGQTYWLSVDLDKFLPMGNKWPKWLNLALGYGAEGMVHAHDRTNEAKGHQSFRQYYLSVDFDLSHIKSRSKIINTLLYVVNLVHLPAPTVVLSTEKGIDFQAFYF